MRLQVVEKGPRKWYHRLRMWMLSKVVGFRPGPQLLATYRPDLLTKDFVSYIMHGSAGSREWTPGEAELFSAFVSDRNACHF